MPLNKATHLEGMRGFDIDLKFGKHFEELIDDIFKGVYKSEVKTERDKWIGYGNMVIETEYNGKPSGLERTEADVWVHNFAYQGELIFSLLIPTDVLKDIVHTMVTDKTARVTKGGDSWKSKLTLVPLKEILPHLVAYAKEKQRRRIAK